MSSMTPVTAMSVALIWRIFPRAPSFPKILRARLLVRTMEWGFFRAVFGSPSTKGKLKISKRDGSTAASRPSPTGGASR
jgi:hypothetical protein